VISDPRDLTAFGAAVTGLLTEPERARRIGVAARERVRDEFLGPHHLGRYFELFEKLVTRAGELRRPAGARSPAELA
jgi:trehalose synthase